MAKSTNRVHSHHFKEASSATFLKRSYLSISLKMTSFPQPAVRSSLQNDRASFKVVSAISQTLLGNKQKNKKSSSKPSSSVTTTPWSCKEPFGGFFRCISLFEPEMSPDGCAGEMYCWKRILKQVENFSFGGRREDQNI